MDSFPPVTGILGAEPQCAGDPGPPPGSRHRTTSFQLTEPA
jgi:hypothetical protein